MRFFRIPSFTGVESHRDDADRGTLRIAEGCVPSGPGGLRSGPVWQDLGKVSIYSAGPDNALSGADDGKGNSLLFASRAEIIHDVKCFPSANTTMVSLGNTYPVATAALGVSIFATDNAYLSAIGNRSIGWGDGSDNALFGGKGPVNYADHEVYPDSDIYSMEYSWFPKCRFFLVGPNKCLFASGNSSNPLTVYISEPAGLTVPVRDSPYSTSDSKAGTNSGALSTVEILMSDANRITALSNRGNQVVVHTDVGAFLLYAPTPDQAEDGYRVAQAPSTVTSAGVNQSVTGGEDGTQPYYLGHDGQIYKDEASSRGSEETDRYSDPDQASWKAKGRWEDEHPEDLSNSFAAYEPEVGQYWVYLENEEHASFVVAGEPVAGLVVIAVTVTAGAEAAAAVIAAGGTPAEAAAAAGAAVTAAGGTPAEAGAAAALAVTTAGGTLAEAIAAAGAAAGAAVDSAGGTMAQIGAAAGDAATAAGGTPADAGVAANMAVLNAGGSPEEAAAALMAAIEAAEASVAPTAGQAPTGVGATAMAPTAAQAPTGVGATALAPTAAQAPTGTTLIASPATAQAPTGVTAVEQIIAPTAAQAPTGVGATAMAPTAAQAPTGVTAVDQIISPTAAQAPTGVSATALAPTAAQAPTGLQVVHMIPLASQAPTGLTLLSSPLPIESPLQVQATQVYPEIVDQIHVGDLATMVSNGDGNIRFLIGDNTGGYVGRGYTGMNNVPMPYTLTHSQNAIDVEIGITHALYVRSDGSLWGAGSSQWGQLGEDGTGTGAFGQNHWNPVQIESSGVVDAAAGYNTSFYAKSDGSVWGTGKASNNNFGTNPNQDHYAPVEIVAADPNLGAEKVWTGGPVGAAGPKNLLWMSNGLNELWGVGLNHKGQLGNDQTVDSSVPVRMRWGNAGSNSYILGAAGGLYMNAWIEVDGIQGVFGGNATSGNLIACGYNNNGQLGDGSTTDRHIPVKIDEDVAKVSAAYSIAYIKSDGSLWKTLNGSPHTPQQILLSTANGGGAVEVKVSFNQIYYTRLDGSLWKYQNANGPVHTQVYP